MGKRRKRLTFARYAKKYASIKAHVDKLKGNITEAVEETIEEVIEEVKERLPNGLVTIAEPPVETNIDSEPAEKPVFASKEEETTIEKPQSRKPRKPRRKAATKPEDKETNTSESTDKPKKTTRRKRAAKKATSA